MKSLQTFRTLRSSRDLFKNDVLGSYFKNRVPYPPLISKKTENSGSPTTRKILEKQWILPILGKDFPDLCPHWGGTAVVNSVLLELIVMLSVAGLQNQVCIILAFQILLE